MSAKGQAKKKLEEATMTIFSMISFANFMVSEYDNSYILHRAVCFAANFPMKKSLQTLSK